MKKDGNIYKLCVYSVLASSTKVRLCSYAISTFLLEIGQMTSRDVSFVQHSRVQLRSYMVYGRLEMHFQYNQAVFPHGIST
jgi:hypothetical protein